MESITRMEENRWGGCRKLASQACTGRLSVPHRASIEAPPCGHGGPVDLNIRQPGQGRPGGFPCLARYLPFLRHLGGLWEVLMKVSQGPLGVDLISSIQDNTKKGGDHDDDATW